MKIDSTFPKPPKERVLRGIMRNKARRGTPLSGQDALNQRPGGRGDFMIGQLNLMPRKRETV